MLSTRLASARQPYGWGYFLPVFYNLLPKVNIFLYFMAVSCDKAAYEQHLGERRVTLKYEVRNVLEVTVGNRQIRWFGHMQPTEDSRRAKEALHWMPDEKKIEVVCVSSRQTLSGKISNR